MPEVARLNGHATDHDRAVQVLTRAFASDPVARWVLPDDRTYLQWFPRFVRAFGGQAMERGTAWTVDDLRGVALWLEPDVHADDEAVGTVMACFVPEDRGDDVATLMERMERSHPEAPHWYLPLIGVIPKAHRRGLGTALLQPVLGDCDRNGTIAYLEATSWTSARLYERFGFQVTAEIRVARRRSCFPWCGRRDGCGRSAAGERRAVVAGRRGRPAIALTAPAVSRSFAPHLSLLYPCSNGGRLRPVVRGCLQSEISDRTLCSNMNGHEAENENGAGRPVLDKRALAFFSIIYTLLIMYANFVPFNYIDKTDLD
jgi:GNAT superfamily N-acetyltransferase